MCIFQHEYFVLCSFLLYSMVFCNRFVFECLVPNIRLLLKARTYYVVDFTTSNLDSMKFPQYYIPWLEFYWLKYCINLELLSVDLPYSYTCMLFDFPYAYICMFQVSINSNVLHIQTRFYGWVYLYVHMLNYAIIGGLKVSLDFLNHLLASGKWIKRFLQW